MGWNIAIELVLEHDFYAPNSPPLTVRPSDPVAFERAGLLARQSGPRFFVLIEEGETDLPKTVALDLDVQNTDTVLVTQGSDWAHVPHIKLSAGTDRETLGEAHATLIAQVPGQICLARVTVDLIPDVKRDVVVHFDAMASHWAYHVVGPGNDDVMIEDSDGEVQFDPLGMVVLPDGTGAQVIRSRAALPARARPGQRFSLSRPGPFGPRTLIPVLPAPQPLFATVPDPDGTGALIQSDIYVSIF